MKISAAAILLAVLATINLPAQQPDKQYWNWYFSNSSAIKFTSPLLPPVMVAGSMMYANEGASSISDTAGNLLYYSNGLSVWDSSHQVIPNGNGLKGHYWSAQSALIVKMPGNDSLYYIFTVNNWSDSLTELNYSIINKNLGAVTAQKNILVNNNCREHLSAAYHSNGQDIWILSHEFGNNHFVAYLLSAQGLDTIPVVSAAGANYNGNNRFGYMRVSPQCNRIATALGKQLQLNIPDTTAQVFDFDNSTGIVSNPVFIADLTNMESAYCCEFSPDNTKVFFTEYNSTAIYQADLTSSNPAATLTNISTSVSGYNSSLTLGPDGKIYVTQSSSVYLGVINSPNLAGAQSNHNADVIQVNNGGNSISTCNILRKCQSTTTTGLQWNDDGEQLLSIYPNPASANVTVLFNPGIFEPRVAARLLLMDVTGREVYSTPIYESSEYSINSSRLARGWYTIQIRAAGRVLRGSLVLQ